MTESGVRKSPHIPPWLFAPMAATQGIGYWGICALVIPYLLRKHGVPVDRIAGVIATASIPTFCYFLWAPVIDLGLRRRTWILLTAGTVALCSALAVAGSAGSLPWLTFFLTASNAISSVGGAAVGAIMATQPAQVRGRAGGWYQTGNIGIGSLGGGAFIWLAERMGLPALSLLAAAAVFLPALAVLRISEIPHPRMAASRLFPALGRDVQEILWSWRTLVGLIFFASPVGAGALGNLISSVGPDYHASGSEVAWVSGLGGSVLLAVGAFAGGFVCDRMHRMSAYAVSGLIAAIFGMWLALAPATPFTYGAGYAGYALSTGFAYTAFTALVLDVLGHGRRAAATGYSVLLSFGNFPVAYMTWVDGAGYRHGGARGLMSVDALANGLGGLLLLVVARVCARRRRRLNLDIIASLHHNRKG